MKFEEVSNEAFNCAFDALKPGGPLALDFKVIGTDYGPSYETLDTSKEYGHMIFKNKQEAMMYLKNKGVAVE